MAAAIAKDQSAAGGIKVEAPKASGNGGARRSRNRRRGPKKAAA